MSEEHKKSLSRALMGNSPWNKGRKASKPAPTQAELDAKAAVRKEKIQQRNKNAAAARKLNTVQRYIDSAPPEWTEVEAVREDTVYVKMKHVPCGTVLRIQAQTVRKWNWESGLCKTCNPIFRGVSKAETEVFDVVSNIAQTDVIRHFKIGSLEYDLLVPDRKLLIEYDGLYWHSEKAGYERDKHLLKTQLAEEHGYRLIHLFEDEWVRKRSIVESRLRALCGMSRRVFARKTEIVELSSSEARSFFEANHIQGYSTSSVRLGLKLNGELLAAMTFARPRYNRAYDWELIRFANVAGTSVVGGAGKLLAEFRRLDFGSIVSYADRRWSDGGLYRALGFNQVGISPPSYWYFKGDLRHNRQTFQKAKLKDLPSYSADKTEVEIMFQEGWNRIWDCGNLIFALDKLKPETS